MKTTLSLIHEDSRIFGGRQWEYKLNSKFLELWSKIDSSSRKQNKPSITKFLQYIFQDLNALIMIAKKLDWQKELRIKGKLTDEIFSDFAQLDIDLFFMKIRSIFDYVTMVLSKIADKPSLITGKPSQRFTKMRTWLTREKSGNDNRKKLGEDLADLVLSVYWFDDLKDVRDSIQHKGSFSLIFSDKKRILFQVTKCSEKLKSIPEIMYNDNVLDFEKFAGLYFGYLIAFLEDFAVKVEQRLPETIRNREYFPCQPFGQYPIIFKWIQNLLIQKP